MYYHKFFRIIITTFNLYFHLTSIMHTFLYIFEILPKTGFFFVSFSVEFIYFSKSSYLLSFLLQISNIGNVFYS